ncbi:hypothetical protein FACS1894132_07100 [Clostridia bacterium]|nr:hypothetical protein FACS1894132_07100 [Clostridia bacterium]
MKKMLILILLVVFLLTACDPYVSKRPYDYKNTTWIAKECNMYFYAGEKYKISHSALQVNGKSYNLDFTFDYGYGVTIYDADKLPNEHQHPRDAILLHGRGSFSEKKFELIFNERSTDNIGLNLKKITFIRTNGEIIPDWAK